MTAATPGPPPPTGLVRGIALALYRSDPVGLAAIGGGLDAYLPEARDLLASLDGKVDPGRLLGALHDVFIAAFGHSAGPRDRYESAAADVAALLVAR